MDRFLFPDMNTPYAGHAGYQHSGTSIAAAKQVSGKAASLRNACLETLKAYPHGLTPDELAELLNEDVLNIRPRITELVKRDRSPIRKIGRRLSKLGNPQSVYALAETP